MIRCAKMSARQFVVSSARMRHFLIGKLLSFLPGQLREKLTTS